MSNPQELKAVITSSLDKLPLPSLEALAELASFLEAKSRKSLKESATKARGLWREIPAIGDEEIAKARQEMWASLGDREI